MGEWLAVLACDLVGLLVSSRRGETRLVEASFVETSFVDMAFSTRHESSSSSGVAKSATQVFVFVIFEGDIVLDDTPFFCSSPSASPSKDTNFVCAIWRMRLAQVCPSSISWSSLLLLMSRLFVVVLRSSAW